MLHEVIGYLEHRISSGVEIRVEPPENMDTPGIRVNRPLFEWVVENISKNAADAMEGTGTLTFAWGIFKNQTFIDISDTGKGIARKNQKTIFKPGYTTKKRGWGLGLTLVRRIVEDYHNGRIFVKESSPGKGTTFRILVG
jgi:signal transduction histidine kinase